MTQLTRTLIHPAAAPWARIRSCYDRQPCCPVSGQRPMEEWANALTHGTGLALSIAGLSLLVTLAAMGGNPWYIVGSAIFGAALILTYGGSTLYHASPSGRWKRACQVIDGSMIYLLIAGTYTPFALGPLRGGWGWSIFGVVWGVAVLGITLKVLCPGRFRAAGIALYLTLGWLILVAVVPLTNSVPPAGVTWLVAGGVAYTAGVILLLRQSLPFSHGAWHLAALAGSASHFCAVLFYLLPY